LVENISIRFLSGALVIWRESWCRFRTTTTKAVLTEDPTVLLPTIKVKTQIKRSLAWMIIVGKNAAVV
jgi:hypothetical protein